jgi:sarcosine oxidase subunit alpha
LLYSRTVTRTEGENRLKRVYYAEVDENMRVKPDTEKYVDCDTLLLSVGLIPENDLVGGLGIEMDRNTSGAVVDEYRQTSAEGIFSAGNVLHVHDLADNVSVEAGIAGAAAADYAKGKSKLGKSIGVVCGGGVRYTVPQKLYKGPGKTDVYLRVDNVYKNKTLKAECGGKTVYSKRRTILTPGEMEKIEIDKSNLTDAVTIYLE